MTTRVLSVSTESTGLPPEKFLVPVSEIIAAHEEIVLGEGHHGLRQTYLAHSSVLLIFGLFHIAFAGSGPEPSQSSRPGGIEDDLIAYGVMVRCDEGVIDGEEGKLRRKHRREVAVWHRISKTAGRKVEVVMILHGADRVR